MILFARAGKNLTGKAYNILVHFLILFLWTSIFGCHQKSIPLGYSRVPRSRAALPLTHGHNSTLFYHFPTPPGSCQGLEGTNGTWWPWPAPPGPPHTHAYGPRAPFKLSLGLLVLLWLHWRSLCLLDGPWIKSVALFLLALCSPSLGDQLSPGSPWQWPWGQVAGMCLYF